VPPVVGDIATDCCPGDEGSFIGGADSFHLRYRWQITEVNPISIGSGESLGELIRIVGDDSSLCISRRLFEFFPNLRLRDGPTNDQESAEHLVLLRKSHDSLFDACCFQINGNQNIMVLVFGDQFQDFINGGDFLASKLGIKPTPRIKAADVGQRVIRHVASPVGSAVYRAVMDADQVTVFGSFHVKLEADPKFEAGPEVSKGILWCVVKQPPVSDDQRSRLLGSSDVGAGCGDEEEGQQE